MSELRCAELVKGDRYQSEIIYGRMSLNVSEVLNVVFGGGLAAALTALITLGPTLRKAKAEAEKAHADAESSRFDNAEHATRILMDNIVEPLKKELNATRREMARLRKAIDGANSCEHRNGCPVLDGVQRLADDDAKRDGKQPGQRAVGSDGGVAVGA